MTQQKPLNLLVATLALACSGTLGTQPAGSAPPAVVQARMDYDASGYVTPAGMAPPAMYSGSVMPVGYYSACDSCGTYDGSCGCDSGCDGACDGGCDSGCGGIIEGGILGKMMHGSACGGCGQSGCGSCAGMSCMRFLCLFCQGDGCSACQMCNPQAMAASLHLLLPYRDAGVCAQRWYDLSAEAIFLSHSSGGLSGPVTSLGTAPLGPIVLQRGDADGGDDQEAGVRLSAAMICGPGGNLEATYVGGQVWRSEAFAEDGGAGLFSFISDFGTNPIGGFDDTDRSLVQAVGSRSEFHSGELNYRRRTVGPYCKFQSSCLIGLRYIRYQDGFLYAARGENDNTVNANLPRFFSSLDDVKNDLFGPQAGFDLWCNLCPGVNVGVGFKGAWVQNRVQRRTILTANSLVAGGPGVATLTTTDRDTTTIGEFEAKLIYRLSHSLSLRSSYYVVAIEDAAFGTVDRQTVRDFISLNPVSESVPQIDDLVIQGVSFGAEWMW